MASESSSISLSTVGIVNNGKDVNINGGLYVTSTNIKTEDLPFDDFPLPRLIDTFRGRNEEMSALDCLFFKANQRKVVICGLPGFGKTELSKQFGQHCLQNEKVQKLLWIKAEKKEDVENSYPKLKKIYEQYNERCLCIYDNGVCRRDIADYQPPGKENFFMLVTSQEKNWGDDVIPLQLTSLSQQFAIDIVISILGKYYKEEDYDLYKQLTSIVDNVPLGLQIICGYIRTQTDILKQNFNLREYVDDMRKSQKHILKKTIPKNMPIKYEKSIYSAMKVSLHKIQKEEDTEVRELALNMLYACSYLNPDDIALAELKEIIPANTIIENQIVLALELLVNYSFVSYGLQKYFIRLHRLTQQFLIYYLSIHDPKSTYYKSCLNYVIYKCNSYSLHSRSVFSNGDNHHIDILYMILKEQKCYNILNTCICDRYTCIVQAILELLVECGCLKCIEKILEKKSWKEKYIYKYNLLFISVKHDQLLILKLLLKYINLNSNKEFECLLHNAVSGETINILIENGANVNAKNYEENSPLFAIAKNRCLPAHLNWNEILTLLKFRKSKTNKNKETLLHMAAFGCHANLIEILITDYGMQVNQQDNAESTPLRSLLKNTTTEIDKANVNRITSILKQLIKHGALCNENTRYLLFNYAVQYNDLDFLMWLLQQNDDIHPLLENVTSLDIDRTNINRITPILKQFIRHDTLCDENIRYLLLKYAVKYNELYLLMWLLQQGVDENQIIKNNDTLLYMAVQNFNLEIIKILIGHQAPSNTLYSQNETIGYFLLSYCVQYNDLEFLKWLLQQGVDVSQSNKYQETILHQAAAKGDIEIIKILINHGVVTNTRDHFDETALFAFVRYGYSSKMDTSTVTAILDLLNYNDPTQVANCHGDCILHWAAHRSHQLVELLIHKYQFDVNMQNHKGNTPLHLLIDWLDDQSNKEDVVETIQTLKQLGADLNIVNQYQRTPLQMLQRLSEENDYDYTYLIPYLTQTNTET